MTRRKPPRGPARPSRQPRPARSARGAPEGPAPEPPARPERRVERRPERRVERRPAETVAAQGLLLYGAHAVLAALANPDRRCRRLLLTEEAQRREGGGLERLARARGASLVPERIGRDALDALLPGAVHQGLALETDPLQPPFLEELLAGLPEGPALLVLLDQVTDPHNVGAVLRSAAVFGAAAVVATERHAAPESGALAKAASGALERVPYLREVNLARSLDLLKQAGFWTLGFASEARQTLAGYDPPERIALCLGAEGSGLRRLTRERCDLLLALPAAGDFCDLNVSNAAAIALYALTAKRLGTASSPSSS